MKTVLKPALLIPQSITNQVVGIWGSTPATQQSLRVSIFVGQVAGTVDLALQDTDAYNVWNDVKATTIGASTDKTITFTANNANITSTAHGFLTGDWIAFADTAGSAAMPTNGGTGAIITTAVGYVVQSIDANTFRIRAQDMPSSPVLIPGSAGTGTITATVIREASLTVQAVASADQTVTPLRGGLRLRATTGASESIQIIEIKSSF